MLRKLFFWGKNGPENTDGKTPENRETGNPENLETSVTGHRNKALIIMSGCCHGVLRRERSVKICDTL